MLARNHNFERVALDGAWIAVELTMVATASRYHVALVDPLPAGLEVINPDLTPSAIPPAGPSPLERRW